MFFSFKAIQQQLRKYGHEPVPLGDILNEIFDMVKPEHPFRISLNDLIRCGQGEVVVNILIDLNGFWTHENRESFGSESSSNSGSSQSVSTNNASQLSNADGQDLIESDLIKDAEVLNVVDVQEGSAENQASSQV